jgi:predicted nucleotidyltransferase
MADFAPDAGISLLSFSGFQVRLSDLLGEEVDLSCTDWMKEHVRERAIREAVSVF